jgi:hypothetical protein
VNVKPRNQCVEPGAEETSVPNDIPAAIARTVRGLETPADTGGGPLIGRDRTLRRLRAMRLRQGTRMIIRTPPFPMYVSDAGDMTTSQRRHGVRHDAATLST